jgi:hypothetical protein
VTLADVLVFVLAACALALIFVVDTWFARRAARREALPPLRGHTWRGDDGD